MEAEDTALTADVAPEGFHYRGQSASPIYCDGALIGFTTLRRRLIGTREQTYADCFMVIPGLGSTTVQCLLPHCSLRGGRQYKIALKGEKGFANILKHIANYHPNELAVEDYASAMATTNTAAKGAPSGNIGALLTMAPAQRELEKKTRSAGLLLRIRECFTEIILHANQTFAIVQNEGFRAAFTKLLQVAETDSIPYVSVRTAVRDVDAALDREDEDEIRLVRSLLAGDPESPFWFRGLALTTDAWTRAGNGSLSVYTYHLVYQGRLREGVLTALAEDVPDHT